MCIRDRQQGASKSEQESEPQDTSATQPQSAAEQEQNLEQIDPELRKLEQVESAREPSRLLRAQMMLQAQQKQPPQNTGKKW